MLSAPDAASLASLPHRGGGGGSRPVPPPAWRRAAAAAAAEPQRPRSRRGADGGAGPQRPPGPAPAPVTWLLLLPPPPRPLPARRRVKCGAPAARNKLRACAQGLRTRGRRAPPPSPSARSPRPAALRGPRLPHALLTGGFPSSRQLSPQFWPSRLPLLPLCPSCPALLLLPSLLPSQPGATSGGPPSPPQLLVGAAPAPAQPRVPGPAFCPGTWWACILLPTCRGRNPHTSASGARGLWPLPGRHPNMAATTQVAGLQTKQTGASHSHRLLRWGLAACS